MGQEFTITMVTDVAKVGLMVSVIVSTAYLTSLVESFKLNERITEEQKRGFKLKILALIVFITWIFYCCVNLLGKSLMPDKCQIRPALTQTSWVVSRAMVYYFFVMRCHIAFRGSMYKFPKWFIIILLILITGFYGFAGGFYIVRSPLMTWIPSMEVCFPSYIFEDNTWHDIGNALIKIQLSGEALLGFLLVGGYAFRLWQLQKAMDAVTDGVSVEQTNFFKIGKKQGKLAWIAYVSSIFLLYIAGLEAMWAFAPWLDGIINLSCVYCTFAYPSNVNVHRYCCECNRNKYCLYLWCFLCYPCNEPAGNADQEFVLKVMASSSGDEETGTTGVKTDLSSAQETTTDLTTTNQ